MFLDYAEIPQGEEYPFFCLKNLGRLELRSRVSVFCGDNGAGKSTLLGLLSQKCGCHSVGQGRGRFSGDVLRRVKIGRTEYAESRFRFSAEEFLEYILGLKGMAEEAEDALEEIEREGKFKGAAKGFAAMPHARTLYEIKNMYGRELAACSHGEGFLEFFKSRVHPRGLYILDEPESALSYENQYRLAYFIHAAAKEEGSQFLIATHSPVLPLIPGAEIFFMKEGSAVQTEYDDLEDVRFLRLFLARKGEKMFD